MTDHFYIHIPFCRQRCPYCKFALTPVFDEFKKKRYLEYLKKEIREYFSAPFFTCEFGKSLREDPEINSLGQKYTIYFGGGTPSVLSHTEIREILECFPFYKKIDTEITLEANPEDITTEYIEGILALGINRISLGVQTLNEKSLTEIHRSDRDTIVGALGSIGTAIGVSGKTDISINIDFILGLPYTLPGETLQGIQALHTKFPYISHTSVYMLEDEHYPKYWKTNSITEEEMQLEFGTILDYLNSIGWNHYELSNFSKPGYESVHNRAYWDHSNSRGFGLSAASYENQARWNNSSSFGGYYKGERENEEKLTPDQIEIENMMFSLRTDGWDINPGSITTRSNIEQLIQDGLLKTEDMKIKPTKTGIFVLDHIMGELLA